MSIDFHQLPHSGIRSLIPYIPGKSIEELAREKNITDIVKLASNENPLGCSPLALSALRAMSPQLIATYPSPVNHPLMARLSNKLEVSTDRLIVSNGSDNLFSIILNCFALHNDKHILIHDYSFSSYAIQAKSFNIPVRSVALNEHWEVSIDRLIDSCTPKTGIIFLANPNNPTGRLITQNEVKRLLESIPESTLVVLDEAYHEYAACQQECDSISWGQQHPNLLITRTFSKIYGLAGLRLGYAIAHPDLIKIIMRVQLPFAVNQAALTAAHAALEDDEFLHLSLKANKEGLLQVSQGFNSLALSYIPSACNFLTFDCGEDASLLYNYLLDKGIIVRPLHPYQMPQFIRVTIGTQEQNARFLNALTSYYSRKKNDK